jgi:hypothetical protein
MRFGGYWVSGERGNIEVAAGEFDDTDLSDHSGWKEAWQNEDPEHPHGYLDPLTMLHGISIKIAGKIDAGELELFAAKFRDGIPWPVNNMEDLALLIQLLIPKALPRPLERTTTSPALADDASDLPF